MMHFNKSLMLKGCMPLAALALATACVDSNYDLDDIDTTSRFTVKDLTVPINLQEIKLKDVLDLDDNDLIITTTDAMGQEIYAIQQGGDISTSDFKINGIHVNAPVIPATHKTFDIPSIPNFGSTTIPAYTLPEIQLKDIPEQTYEIELNDVDAALLELENVKTKASISVEVVLKINTAIMSGNQVSFKNLVVKMPWGLMAESNENVKYNPENGKLEVSELAVGSDGKARFSFQAYGLDMQGKGKVENNKLEISGQVGIERGSIVMTVTNVAIPSELNLDIEYNVSSFDIASFSGSIDYKMDDINIAPITLNDLPDFLDSPETVIKIANPTISVNVNNPVGQYGLEGHGQIVLSSEFDGGNTTPAESDVFTVGQNGANLVFDNDNFPHLGDILTNENVGGLPKEINVSIKNLQFAGHAVDFPIGDNFGNAQGDYQFTAPLGFGKGSTVIYETTEDGWYSKDLDKVNIEYINLTADCYTPTLPVGIQLSVVPVDKNGNVIPVTEDSGNFKVAPLTSDEKVSLRIQGKNGPIHGFDGIRFRAIISQDSDNSLNEEAIGPDLGIELRNIRITVDGYYETDF